MPIALAVASVAQVGLGVYGAVANANARSDAKSAQQRAEEEAARARQREIDTKKINAATDVLNTLFDKTAGSATAAPEKALSQKSTSVESGSSDYSSAIPLLLAVGGYILLRKK